MDDRANQTFTARTGVLAFTCACAANYLVWRLTTLNLHAAWIALPLLAAEVLGILHVLGFQWTLYRQPAHPRPKPTGPLRLRIFILIPTLNEDPSVLEPTLRGAIAARDRYLTHYPDAQITIALCNDGLAAGFPGWREAEDLAKRLGVLCITRPTPGGAKAGNIEYARQQLGAGEQGSRGAEEQGSPEPASRPLAHLPTRPLAHSPTRPLVHSSTRPLAHLPTRPLVHSPTRPLAHSPTGPLAHGDALLALFDADQVPDPDFLLETVPLIADPSVGWVQTPQYYRNQENTVARWAQDQQALFYHVLCPARAPGNAVFICGSNVVIRAAALDEIGGFPQDSVTEDFAASIRLHGRWRGVYLDRILARGLGPTDLRSYFRQQRRWACGTLGVFRSHWREILLPWRGDLSLDQRVQYFLSGTHYLCGLRDLVYLLAPVIFALTGISPLRGVSTAAFLWHFLPYYILSQFAFWWAIRGVRGAGRGVREQQEPGTTNNTNERGSGARGSGCGAREMRSRGAGEWGSRGAGEQRSARGRVFSSPHPLIPSSVPGPESRTPLPGLPGMLIGFASFPVLVGAALTVFCGVRIGFQVTDKGKAPSRSWRCVLPHLSAALLCAAGVGASIHRFEIASSGTRGMWGITLFWLAQMFAALLASLLLARTSSLPARLPLSPAPALPLSPSPLLPRSPSLLLRLSLSPCLLVSLSAVLALQAVASLSLHNLAAQDEGHYLTMGPQFLHYFLGGPLPPEHYERFCSGAPFFYPVLAGLAALHGGLEAARDLSFLFAAATTVTLYFIARRLYGGEAAIAAVALFSTLPSILFIGHYATYDTLCLFLLSLAILLALQPRPSVGRAAGLGCLLAAAVIAKYAGLLFAPPILCLFAWRLLQVRGAWAATPQSNPEQAPDALGPPRHPTPHHTAAPLRVPRLAPLTSSGPASHPAPPRPHTHTPTQPHPAPPHPAPPRPLTHTPTHPHQPLQLLQRLQLLHLPALAIAVMAAILALVIRIDPDVLVGFFVSTAARVPAAPRPPAALLLEMLQLGGAVAILAVVGLALEERNRRPLGAILLLAALLAPGYHLLKGESVSLDKHVAYGLLFAAPLAGFAVKRFLDCVTRSGVHRTVVSILLLSAFFLHGLQQARVLFGLWPNNPAVLTALAGQLRPGDRVLSEDYEVQRYYLLGQVGDLSWSHLYYFDYPSGSRRLVGLPAYRAALRDGYFNAVVLSGDREPALARSIESCLRSTPRYRLIARIPLYTDRDWGVYTVWTRRPITPARERVIPNPAPWQLEEHGAASAGLGRDDGAIRVDVRSVDGIRWHVQLYQAGAPVKDGGLYTLRFTARATPPRTVYVYSSVNSGDYHLTGLGETVTLDSRWRTYEIPFQVSSQGRLPARLPAFQLGTRDGVFWLKDVRLIGERVEQRGRGGDKETRRGGDKERGDKERGSKSRGAGLGNSSKMPP